MERRFTQNDLGDKERSMESWLGGRHATSIVREGYFGIE
jgi:hypothetical protein